MPKNRRQRSEADLESVSAWIKAHTETIRIGIEQRPGPPARSRIAPRPGLLLATGAPAVHSLPALSVPLTGASSVKWINVESPKVNNRRVNLLGELPDGNLVHIELQSRNEKDFPPRMAEYLFGIGLRYGRLPRQVVLYVGEAPLRVRNHVEGPDVSVQK